MAGLVPATHVVQIPPALEGGSAIIQYWDGLRDGVAETSPAGQEDNRIIDAKRDTHAAPADMASALVR